MTAGLRFSLVRLVAIGALVSAAIPGAFAADPVDGRATVVMVAGAAGDPLYQPDIAQQAEAWQKASATAGAKFVVIGTVAAGGVADHDQLQQALNAETKAGSGELWLGNPAKCVRTLSEQDIAQLYYSAQHYVRLKDMYLAEP